MDCKKVRPNQAFSNKQLQDLRHYLYTYGERSLTEPGVVRCRTCIGGQTSELTCYICDQTKGLDEFAKAQRRTPDEAVRLDFSFLREIKLTFLHKRCLSCVEKVLNTEPGVEDAGEGIEEESKYYTAKVRESLLLRLGWA
jgi:hypothetical protein